VICKHCHNTLPDDSAFCQFCGKAIEISCEPPAAPTPAPTSVSAPKPTYAPPPAPAPAVKTVYCRLCGHPIDSETKQCTGCGKQYFRGIRPMTFLCIVMGLAILALAVTCLVMDYQYREQIDALQELLSYYRV